ncbi:hypothetical protein AB0E81_35325 [Streptomyces sp. NPDC033538]|uniref:hypothetical protein n=1 Tax=Streptomyces sp. NPDC033538 TaxID=3155367 RepID=UPI0033C1CC09
MTLVEGFSRYPSCPGDPQCPTRQADPGFLATAFMELAATVHPPPQDDCTPAPADRLAQDVVDLFLRGAGPDNPLT